LKGINSCCGVTKKMNHGHCAIKNNKAQIYDFMS
jgi:hypothetical protein